MFLPTLPYGGGKTARQTVTFGGVRYGRGGGYGSYRRNYRGRKRR